MVAALARRASRNSARLGLKAEPAFAEAVDGRRDRVDRLTTGWARPVRSAAMSAGPINLKKDQEQREVQTAEFRDINIDYSPNSISCISNLVYGSVSQYDAGTWGLPSERRAAR